MNDITVLMGMTRKQTQLALIIYTVLLVYGTWFPADRWDWSLGGIEPFFAMEWPARIGRPDLIINLLVYIPFGLLVAALTKRSRSLVLTIAAMGGLALSCLLEFGQTYLPGRVTSPSDIVLNTAGSALGAFGFAYIGRSDWIINRSKRIVGQLRDRDAGTLGLGVLILWVVAQWAPFVPSLDFGNLKFGLAPFRRFLSGGDNYFIFGFIEYLAMLTGLMAIGLRLFKNRDTASLYLSGLIVTVLLGKVVIMTRQLAPEALLAAVCVTVFALKLRRLRSTPLQVLALAALLTYQVVAAFKPQLGDPILRPMNWVPFRGQMNSVNGLIDLLAPLWLFAAYAYLMYPRRYRSAEGLVLRLILIAPITLVLEWAQQAVPGRYPDITDVIVAIAAFLFAYSAPQQMSDKRGGNQKPHTVPVRTGRWRKMGMSVLAGVVGLALLSRFYLDQTSQVYALPELDRLPNPVLSNFRYLHPRLPAPEPDDWSVLLRENPQYVANQRRKAAAGDFYARILLARTETSESGLATLFNDLMQLTPQWRGHNQTIPIALAYDWLHSQWTPDQRARLLAKAELACDYQIDFIRNKQALSPYNVILYNQPLQALVMAALATHGDATRGDCMRFTHDYWTKRVVPVWRQVMGKRGGWHEGGEYVGIGIGSAIHRLPAMWRHATREDLFATLPGLRGFLDFELQRRRPDGTHIRLGDIAYPRRAVPDLAPLALEFEHAAAYTASNPPDLPTPLGFPWGGFSNNAMESNEAIQRSPRVHWFDGIGLLIARTNWNDSATYVSAKAGNNYWSHMHLDQGSFTIFKGEALALDSGAYIDYGGDHHLNYTYQSIAHNLVTFTDPADTAPMLTKGPRRADGKRGEGGARAIANDGGQRRVGSGWGKPAPLDIKDWMRQEATYRTVGDVLHSTQRSDFVWLNADLTPAYTNSDSGNREFSARTRRVERYLRTFVFLPELDLVFVHDRIRLSKTTVRPRWLLHSNYEPFVDAGEFRIEGTQGRLHGQVLLPETPNLLPVGGAGFEFFVADKNYDEEGRVQKRTQEKGERVGRWRLEIEPSDPSRDVEYLVAMRASLAGLNDLKTSATPKLELQRSKGRAIVILPEHGQRLVFPEGMAEPTLESVSRRL